MPFQLHTTELPLKSPFTCTCIKEIWLLIQLLVDRLHENGGHLNSFWRYFDAALNLHRERKSKLNHYNQKILKFTIETKFVCLFFSDPYVAMKQLCISRDTVAIFPNDSTMFSLWLLNGIASLQGYSESGIFHGGHGVRVRENADLLDSLLKAFVLAEPSEQHLRAALLIVNSLFANWWPQKSELLMHFWEYFHKKLNSTFYVGGTTPANLAVVG